VSVQWGDTALIYAGYDGHTSIGSKLIRAGSNINAKNTVRRTKLLKTNIFCCIYARGIVSVRACDAVYHGIVTDQRIHGFALRLRAKQTRHCGDVDSSRC
jgi:hypothetical protein